MISATLALDHISATMTYMVWNEEHLWNISVHQSVHLFCLVYSHIQPRGVNISRLESSAKAFYH
jgi:hypothetical protein